MATRRSTILNTSALTDPVDRAALREYRKSLPESVRPTSTVPALLIIFILFTSFIAVFFAWVLLDDRSTPASPADVATIAPMALMPLAGIAFLAMSTRRRSGTRQYRLARFAADNRFQYDPVIPGPYWSGMVFEGGTTLTLDMMRLPSPRASVGNHRSTTGSGRNQKTVNWGFVSIQLGTTLPHIVLDARGNNSLFGVSSLPAAFEREQRLNLEGGFDRHFQLYCPRGYEADALYLFTPDIMARFMDHAAELDVEIIDDRMHLLSRQALSDTDPATWEWVVATVDALTEKIDQWRRWRDDRLGQTTVDWVDGVPQVERPPVGVARPGRRLTQKFPWFWMILGIVGLIFGVFSIVSEVASWFTE